MYLMTMYKTSFVLVCTYITLKHLYSKLFINYLVGNFTSIPYSLVSTNSSYL
ncbi:hypothetical protein NT07LI_2391 [Listeria innocua FSL S4-378]|nr:hypothetical protein NT07LI_2391 [Listeria innocua FSL S4-378]